MAIKALFVSLITSLLAVGCVAFPDDGYDSRGYGSYGHPVYRDYDYDRAYDARYDPYKDRQRWERERAYRIQQQRIEQQRRENQLKNHRWQYEKAKRDQLKKQQWEQDQRKKWQQAQRKND